MSAPTISTIIPAHDVAGHLGACLDSVTAQRGPFQHEVIVVDDASTDTTARVAAAHPGVRLLRLPVNSGPSAARNLGIEAASGALVAFLDADDLWPPGRLAAGLAVLSAHPDIGLVFGDCALFDDQGERLASFFADAGLDERFWGDALRVVDQDLKLFRLNYIPTGAVLVRREHLLAVGGFDPARRLVEDLELWLRLAQVCAFAHVPAVWQHKRCHAASASNRREAMALANLEVLGGHWRRRRPELRRRGLRMHGYFAYEYLLLGDLRARAGDLRGARRWYLRALRTAPSLRALYHWLRALALRPSVPPQAAPGGEP
ncbi:glycosyltransferase family 2 protein [uncultured Thiohalocapsa sp.]|uniref:glycosyltransferase family 2 protein n=1 Tax=uncultured Thiohalocapsa sp. TaxID=768990 RepID=UPI0025DAAD07|nr:glycosyltransferase family 2 protein [uncultured Thiohalocapsa sp.]